MTFPKFLAIASVFLFVTIVALAFMKSGKSGQVTKSEAVAISSAEPIPIVLERELHVVQPQPAAKLKSEPAAAPLSQAVVEISKETAERPLPEADLIYQLFNKGEPKLPFIETIVYKSRVPWLKGRPAWLSDYASYYGTSRHFIARSLNGKPDYFRQDIAEGDTFNVFRKDKNIQFHLLIDITRCKLWFYAIDLDSNQRTLLKTYRVGLGRVDSQRGSGLLTPLGKYALGSKVAIYRPKIEGYYNGQKTEMVRVFGSRWIPFEKEISGCSAPAKGLGVHGVPWVPNATGALIEDTSSLGKYESDGCVRLATADVEELFAILLTKPTVIELVRDFFDAKLPGVESSSLSTARN